MIKTCTQYFIQGFWPRIGSVLLGTELWIAALIATIVVFERPGKFAEKFTFAEFGSIYLTYAAIAVGFCLTGLTIVLTLPDTKFAEKLARKQLPEHIGTTRNAYSDLLFVFSWTAIVHWLAMSTLIIALMYFSGAAPVLEKNASLQRQAAEWFLLDICAYSGFQLLITLITLTQVGEHYIAGLQGPK